MGRVAGVVVSAASLAVAWLAAPAIARAEDGPYPVWWSPKLELESLDKIDERLARPIWADGDAIELYRDVNEETAVTTASTCTEVLYFRRHGYSGRTQNEHSILLYNFAWCRAIELLDSARPAATSFTRRFIFSDTAPKALTPLVGGSAFCSELCWAVNANRHHVPWSAVESRFDIEVIDPLEVKITASDWRNDLSILARGDFNSDGLDDVVIFNNSGPVHGTGGGADTFVLTREAPDGVLWVLDGTQYIERGCPDYYCEEE